MAAWLPRRTKALQRGLLNAFGIGPVRAACPACTVCALSWGGARMVRGFAATRMMPARTEAGAAHMSEPQVVVHDRAQAEAALAAAEELGVRDLAAQRAGCGGLCRRRLSEGAGRPGRPRDRGRLRRRCRPRHGGAAHRLPQACVLGAGGGISAAGRDGGGGRRVVPSRGAGAAGALPVTGRRRAVPVPRLAARACRAQDRAHR